LGFLIWHQSIPQKWGSFVIRFSVPLRFIEGDVFAYPPENSPSGKDLVGIEPGPRYLGRRTNLVDFMRERLERPGALVE
jgi:hypothetical protein